MIWQRIPAQLRQNVLNSASALMVGHDLLYKMSIIFITLLRCGGLQKSGSN